ncbi:hypothetical protein ACWKTS_36295 [Bacillus toyonensis]|uniref:hypothetical protein n=1 Tax=Bacillus toyonensis TaxID=155322 RepID=UPI000BF04613|nr:hypothetical protein [Bacillus toyonensis]PEK71945.1 hypothetical protein CN594_34965 [Bacillus toyonensis]PEO40760.1 hypothetical protein CN579_34760 [Bacillus toyonensis]PFY27534.1 hypothetical protein COL55_35705 [Bacillus toyonensis]PFY35755.1 hypothetical protein COL54_28285 [Bacillus toyonensis]PGD01156.1 hypothetical protein COM37_34065 [Bacillus toyonensis]
MNELKDAYTHLSPMIDTDVYMQWLYNSLKKLDCKIIERKIEGSLLQQEAYLKKEFQIDVIVNCSGLGSR